MKRYSSIALFMLLVFFGTDAFGAKRYWISAASANWNAMANWSTSSGGAGGASVPGSSDTAYFNNGGTGSCTINATVNVKRFDVSSGYTGTISQGANTITVGSGNAVFSGGTFSGGSVSITVNGTLTISGTAFTSTSNTLSVSSDMTVSSGSFTANSGTVSLTATSTLTISRTGGVTFYNLTFAPTSAATFTITSTTAITVSNQLSYSGSAAITLNTGTINVTGNVTTANNTSTGGGGSATIAINSTTASQTLTGNGTVGGGALPIVTVTKSSQTLNLVSTISIANSFTINTGTISAGTSKVALVATGTLTVANTGGTSFYDLTYAPSSSTTFTVTSTASITVSHQFEYAGSGAITLNSGTINVTGNITTAGNTATGGGGSATLAVNNTSAGQTITGNSGNYVGGGALPVVSISKSSTTLTLSGLISVAGNFTWNSGSISAGTSTLAFSATNTITISGTILFNKITFASNSTTTYTLASGTTLIATDTLQTGGTGGLTYNGTSGSGTIEARSHIKLGNTGTGGGGNALLLISQSNNQSFIGYTGASAYSRLPNVQINKNGGTLTLSNSILVAGNWTYSSGTITPGSSTVGFALSKTIKGNHTLANVVFSGGSTSTFTIATGTTLTATGTVTISGTNAVKIDSGTVACQGDINITNTSTTGGGMGLVLINGTGTQTLTGNGTAGQGRLPKVQVEKSSGTLYLASIISVANDWTYNTGTVNANTNSATVAFYGSLNLDGQGTSSTMSFYNVTVAGSTITLTGNLTASNNLVINSTTTLSAGSNTLTVGGNWTNNGTWTYATSTVLFNGSGYNNISNSSGTETFYNLSFNRPTRSQTLLNPVKVNNVLTLTKGHVKTTSTNILELIDNATLSGGGIGAYVHGPVRKTGNDAFTFPLGDTTLTDSTAYHPLSITAPSVTTDQYEAYYKGAAQSYGSSLGSGLASISNCEYWTLERKAGTSNVTPKLGWNSNCDNGSFSEMHVASWNGSQWTDLGQASYTMTWPNGTVTATTALTFSTNPAPLTIAYASVSKSFATLSKTLDGGFYLTDGYVLYFGFDEEYKDVDAKLSFKVYKVSTDRQVTLVSNPANNPSDYFGNNRYKMDLFDNTNTALASGYYVLEVTNDKNEKWYLRFKI